ncbi:MAG: sigma-70 family RNA polymerase sigma factor [Planctomycetota bacterium]|jgi:RNA polymerase sigma factor (sigma-70 family)
MRTIKEINQLPDELSAEDELKLLQQKDTSAAARDELVERTLKSAIRFASSLTKGRLPLDEVFSIAGMALMRSVQNYVVRDKDNARLLTYTKPYLRGEIIKAWRLRDPLDYGADIPEKIHEPEPDIEVAIEEEAEGPDYDLIHQHERWAMVEPLLDRLLSETERRILVLQFEARLNGAEIARMIGCTRANIRESRNRALKKIRLALYREGKINE